MALRDILLAGREAGVNTPGQLVALVVLVEVEAGGDAGEVPKWAPKADQYPGGWSPADLARYGPRIALATPRVTREIFALGIEAVPGAVETVTEPVLEAAREPVRVLMWLVDPGTVIRVLMVVGGGLLILAGVFVAAQPMMGQQALKVAGLVKGGKGAR